MQADDNLYIGALRQAVDRRAYPPEWLAVVFSAMDGHENDWPSGRRVGDNLGDPNPTSVPSQDVLQGVDDCVAAHVHGALVTPSAVRLFRACCVGAKWIELSRVINRRFICSG